MPELKEFDTFEGKALARNTALAQGWTFQDNGGDSFWHYDTAGGRTFCWMERAYRPDLRFSQALELGGDEWLWESIEFHSGFRNGPTTGLLTEVRHRLGSGRLARVSVAYADFPTKEVAYATARCWVFLKAKEGGDGD